MICGQDAARKYLRAFACLARIARASSARCSKFAWLLALLLPTAWQAALADAYPSRPIRIVVGYPPGGSGDFIARTMSAELARRLGQSIVIDNRPGAGTNIASEMVAKSAPDGYTLLLGNNSSHGINKALYQKLGFDPERDFAPITKVSSSPLVISVHPSVRANSLRELIALAKGAPGQLNFASSGNGSPPHLAGVLFNSLTGVDIVHVPFKGGAPAVLSTLAGQTQVIFGTPPVVLPHIRAGKLRALATTTRTRSPVVPDVPSATESGLPNYEVLFWFGLFAPKATPAPVLQQLFKTTVAVLATQQIKESFAREGVKAQPSPSPEAFRAAIRAEAPFWQRLVASSGASVD